MAGFAPMTAEIFHVILLPMKNMPIFKNVQNYDADSLFPTENIVAEYRIPFEVGSNSPTLF